MRPRPGTRANLNLNSSSTPPPLCQFNQVIQLVCLRFLICKMRVTGHPHMRPGNCAGCTCVGRRRVADRLQFTLRVSGQ